VACYTPIQVAQEIVNQGGSKAQAWVGAALVDGIESNGCTDDANPTSTACGLFQFLDTTWGSNGGTKYSASGCGATMPQQVTVFLTASAGSNFYPWAPDLGGSYDGNTRQAAATAPQQGSPVYNTIAKLASTTTIGALLGNVPTNWADAGAALPASPTPLGPLGSGIAPQSGTSNCVIPLPITFPGLGGCILSQGQVKAITGALAIAGGGLLFLFGVVMLAGYGYDNSGAKQAVNSTARRVGIGASLLTGQPELAAGIGASGGRTRSRSAGTADLPQASRRESREIERRFRDTQEQIEGGGRPRISEQRRRTTENGAARSRRFEQRRARLSPRDRESAANF
jgi:hypothetical protein